jgi:hypothetical protein
MTSETQILFEDNTHNFKVLIAPCLITGRFDKCILAKLTDVDFTDEHGEKQTAEIFGQFSETGLGMLQEALRSAPLPIPLETPDQVRQKANYHWYCIYQDGTVIRQFEAGVEEKHIGHVDLHKVVQFWVLPRDPKSELPWFCLNRGRGLCRVSSQVGELEQLDLPFPNVPFHIEYQRRVTKTFTCGAPGFLDVPVQIQHELGWRVDTLHGDDHETTLIIAIEDTDGSWQISCKEPLDSRHFGSRQIVAECGVRIVEMLA